MTTSTDGPNTGPYSPSSGFHVFFIHNFIALMPKVKGDKDPKKPPNQFFLYKKDVAGSILQKYGKLSNGLIAKYAAEMWAAESAETKAYYADLAKTKVQEHMARFPNFVWPSKSTKYTGKKRLTTKPTPPKVDAIYTLRDQDSSSEHSDESFDCISQAWTSCNFWAQQPTFDAKLRTGWTPPPETIGDILSSVQFQYSLQNCSNNSLAQFNVEQFFQC
jgi:hypothetical protein